MRNANTIVSVFLAFVLEGGCQERNQDANSVVELPLSVKKTTTVCDGIDLSLYQYVGPAAHAELTSVSQVPYSASGTLRVFEVGKYVSKDTVLLIGLIEGVRGQSIIWNKSDGYEQPCIFSQYRR